MKLVDLFEGKKKGTYAGVRFSDKTNDAIMDFIKENKIPNSIKPEKLHTTLLYSRKHCPKYEPAGELEETMVGHPEKFEKWPSQPDENGKVAMCLVLRYHCPKLAKRHAFLMDEHDATYDFDEYKPHITFSYDVGELQCKDLPNFTQDIEIVEEYAEDLNLDWAKENTDKSG